MKGLEPSLPCENSNLNLRIVLFPRFPSLQPIDFTRIDFPVAFPYSLSFATNFATSATISATVCHRDKKPPAPQIRGARTTRRTSGCCKLSGTGLRTVCVCGFPPDLPSPSLPAALGSVPPRANDPRGCRASTLGSGRWLLVNAAGLTQKAPATAAGTL